MNDLTTIDTLVRHFPGRRIVRSGNVGIRCRCGLETWARNDEVDGPYSAENNTMRRAERRHLEHALAVVPATDEDDGRLPGSEFRARFLADDRDHWKARAVKAEAERDEVRAMTARDLLTAAWAAGHVPEDGKFPVGAPIITRARDTGYIFSGKSKGYGDTFWAERRLLDPPTPKRPEGAEELEAVMRELVASHPEDHYGDLADHLASRGVRVVPTEDGAS